jgi:Lar family restriction alleviation protein
MKIKKCPFCGSKNVEPHIGVIRGLSMMMCYDCGATVSFQDKEKLEKLVKAWNKRAGE